jgi:hypothetical protein
LLRGQVADRLANMAPCLVGMEACVGAHHVVRAVSRAPNYWASTLPLRVLKVAPSRAHTNPEREPHEIQTST